VGRGVRTVVRRVLCAERDLQLRFFGELRSPQNDNRVGHLDPDKWQRGACLGTRVSHITNLTKLGEDGGTTRPGHRLGEDREMFRGGG